MRHSTYEPDINLRPEQPTIQPVPPGRRHQIQIGSSSHFHRSRQSAHSVRGTVCWGAVYPVTCSRRASETTQSAEGPPRPTVVEGGGCTSGGDKLRRQRTHMLRSLVGGFVTMHWLPGPPSAPRRAPVFCRATPLGCVGGRTTLSSGSTFLSAYRVTSPTLTMALCTALNSATGEHALKGEPLTRETASKTDEK